MPRPPARGRSARRRARGPRPRAARRAADAAASRSRTAGPARPVTLVAAGGHYPARLVALLLASITDPLVNFAVNVVGDLGLPGICLVMSPEAPLIPLASDATILLAGVSVFKREYSLFAAVAGGSTATLVGSWIAYATTYC